MKVFFHQLTSVLVVGLLLGALGCAADNGSRERQSDTRRPAPVADMGVPTENPY